MTVGMANFKLCTFMWVFGIVSKERKGNYIHLRKGASIGFSYFLALCACVSSIGKLSFVSIVLLYSCSNGYFSDEITVKVCGIDDKAVVVSLINGAGDSFLTESGANSTTATPITKSTPAAPATQPVLKIAAQQCQVGPFNGYLSHEVSQQEFYVQRTSDTELLDSVTTRVQDQSASPQIISPVIGQACIAKFRDDGAWYRAEITSISDTEVQVLFVDFGNSSSVDRADILVISEELSKIPAIAVPCKLTTQAPDQSLTEWAAGLYHSHIFYAYTVMHRYFKLCWMLLLWLCDKIT